jgi:hypothetical protein
MPLISSGSAVDDGTSLQYVANGVVLLPNRHIIVSRANKNPSLRSNFNELAMT